MPLRPKQRALLAALALRLGEPVSLDRLVDDLWGERPPATATASLQNAVSLVRRALGDGVVVTRAPGYALGLDAERVDAVRFARLVEEARTLEPADRAPLLHEALALWRGRALADLADEPFAAVEIDRLEEQRATAREDLAEAELARGRNGEVISELERLVAEQPFRERPRALLMLALYRAGRQADALAAYAEARRFLVAELGVEPSPALRTLQQAVLRQDPALDPPAAAPLTRLPDEERRATVTVVFCDVVDSTALGAALDAEAYRDVLRRYYRGARTVLERHGGTVEKFVGDAVLGVFGVPERREDDALRAVRAADELHPELARLDGELERAHGVRLAIRVGVNTGEVVVGEPDSGYSYATGHAVNVAAKLQQAAGAGETLVGAATLRLVRDAVRVDGPTPLELGPRAAPVPAYRLREVRGREGVARNLTAPLVGRDRELAALHEAWAQAVAGPECRLVCVVGEAGIGKTRLARELVRGVEGDATVLVGRCVSYGEGATYLPIAEVLRTVAPDASEAGLAAAMGDGPDARLVARRLRELTGLEEGAPPPGEGFWAVGRFLQELARVRPVLLVLDDVHWAEPTLLDLVDHLAEQALDAPVLLLCLGREVRESWRERVLAELAPLSPDETDVLVANLWDAPGPVRDRIVAGAEGNALFAEQLVAHVLDAGEAALEAVPGTVEALLASRLDRLPEHERAVLERAAVVGRDFWRGAVAALAGRDVGDALAALVARGLVWQVPSQLADEDAFRFHHVLIRDVAYSSITKERRSDLHRRAAVWLDGHADGRDEVVGYHLEQAYRLRSDLGRPDREARALAEEAGARLGTAGIRAWKRADAPAAVNLLQRAAALLPDGELRAEILCELAVALRSSGEGAVVQTLQEAERAAAAGHIRRVLLRARVELAHAGLYGVDALRATPEDVLATASSAIPELEELGDERALARTWLAIADVHCLRVDNKAWGEAATVALHYYRRSGWSPSVCFSSRAAAYYYGSTPVRTAIRGCLELLDDAGDDRHAVASVSLFAAGLHAMQRRFDEARRLAAEAGATLAANGARLTLATAHSAICAEIERLAGNLAETEAILRRSCSELEAMGQTAYLGDRAAQLADVLCDQGRVDEARASAQIAERNGIDSDPISAVHRLSVRARLLARAGGEGAEAPARTAVELLAGTDATNQRAKSLLDLADVLRLTSQSPAEVADLTARALRLYRRKGNVVEAHRARSLLAEMEGTRV